MKITGLETIILKKAVKNPVSDALHTYDAGVNLITRISTDEGFTGYANTVFGRTRAGHEALKIILEKELAPVIIGEDPHFSRRIRDKLFVATEYYGTLGIANFAIAAIDQAIWDIVGKAAGQPVGKLLGAYRDRIPVYAMVGWYFGNGESEFVRQCTDAAEEGFRAVKLKVGRDSLDDDIKRIKRIKQELGDDFRIMVDANCAFGEIEAMRRGRVYEELGVYWFEEPMQPYMRDSHIRLAAALDIPIAIGENYFTRHQFYDVIKSGAVDIVQLDNRRAGGVTEWLDIAAVSELAGLKLASHGGGPANVNVLCAMPNAIYLESGSLKAENSMLVTQLKMVDGEVLLPDAPGMGTEISEDYMRAYRVM
jgi:L-alanine-DL-glutamate epimerase-like enolase superfamily enzyme